MKNSKRNREKVRLGSPTSPCYYSSSPDGIMTCSYDGQFTHEGYAVNLCKYYPCRKIKEARAGGERG